MIPPPEAEYATAPDLDGRARLGRVGAALVAATGLAVLVTAPGLARPADRAAPVAAGAAAVALAFVLAVLPWRRWPDGALLAVPGATFAALSAIWWADPPPGDHYLGLVLAPFVFLGIAGRPGRAAAAAPVAAAAYVVAVAARGSPRPTLAFAVVVAGSVLAGEVLARARDARRRSEGNVGHLLDASRALAQATDEREAASALAVAAADLLHAPYVSVLVTHDVEGELVERSHRRLPRPIGALKVNLEAHGRLLRVALESGRLVFVSDARALDPVALPNFGITVRSVAALPLRGEDRVLGVALVMWARSKRRLDPGDRRAVELLAGEAGRVLARLREAPRTALEAEVDPLTNVANRRAYAKALSRLQPGDAIVLIDLDHFGEVNERLGHAAGDETLRALATTMREVARRDDHVARYGGDELAMILGGAGEDGATAALVRLRRVWAERAPATTFSAGVAVRRGAESPAATLGRADAALYQAKAGGRDRDELATVFAAELADQLGG